MGKLIKFLASLLITLLLLACLVLALIQTRFGKETLTRWIIDTGKQEGMEISIGSIEGHLPFKWELGDVRVRLNETDTLAIDKAKLRISFFPLLYKRLSISYLDIRRASYCFAAKDFSSPAFTLLPLPVHASLKSLSIKEFEVTNLTTNLCNTFALDGSGYAAKNFTDAALKVRIHAGKTAAMLSFVWEEELSMDLHIDGELTDLLTPFAELPFASGLDLQATLKGPRAPNAPLQGQVFGYITRLDVSRVRALDQKWKIASSFTVTENRSVRIADLLLQSPLLSCKASGKISERQELEHGTFFLNIPRLSRFDADAGVPLKGSLQIEADYSPSEARWDLVTQDVKIGDFSYPNATGTLAAKKVEGEWQGTLALSASNDELPLQAASTFTAVMPHALRIENLQISSGQASLTGRLSVDTSLPGVEGALAFRVPHLGHFHDACKGSLGAAVTFSEKDHVDVQLTLAQFQYLEMAVRDLSLRVTLDDLFASPEGSVEFDAAGVRYRQLDLASCGFKTRCEQDRWPFELHAQGLWKDGLELRSAGSWSYAGKVFGLNLQEFTGFMLKKAFVLNKPCSITRSKDLFTISPCDMQVGIGTLTGSMSLTEEDATGQVCASHFPLEYLMVLEPPFTLQGNASFEGALEGRQGHLSLWLEGADVYQFGKPVPLKAKGSLQAHLDKQMLQVHAHLAASDKQFFEMTASLPMEAARWKFEQDKPLSCELTMEGKLEEIFDFINIGSHRAGGFLSARLLLSHTLRSPLLKGEMELQAGTYENDYTGTQIKEVRAQARAEGKTVRLVSFFGKDHGRGSLTAEGTLECLPHAHFPYAIEAHLDALNVLNFDTITGNFTGPLSVTGTTEAAYARGNLAVSKAEMKIPDELLIDIPVVPITFIHQPAHLKDALINPLPTFPFHLDLNLDVPGKVEVRGRGLTSEWQGKIHLTGLNVNFAASGKLALVKGEYLFSGKTFKLTQGEISISDKPAQSAYLNLSGTLELPKMTVIAFLRGPLTSPAAHLPIDPCAPHQHRPLLHPLQQRHLRDLAGRSDPPRPGAHQPLGRHRPRRPRGHPQDHRRRPPQHRLLRFRYRQSLRPDRQIPHQGSDGDASPRDRQQQRDRRGRTQAGLHLPSRDPRRKGREVYIEVE